MRNALSLLVAWMALALAVPTAASANVEPFGWLAGPAGFGLYAESRPCVVQADERPLFYVYVDNKPDDYYTAPSIADGAFLVHLETEPGDPLGVRRVSFQCLAMARSSTQIVRTVWSDAGFDLTVTGPGRQTTVNKQRATTSSLIEVYSGAPEGPDACPGDPPGASSPWAAHRLTYSPALGWDAPPIVEAFRLWHTLVRVPDAQPTNRPLKLEIECLRRRQVGLWSYPASTFRYSPAAVQIVGAGTTPDGACLYGPRRPGDTNCDGIVRVAVLGDSYISGEGASDEQRYLSPTDEGDNKCHRTTRSWAVQVARELSADADVTHLGHYPTRKTEGDAIVFLACSGAVTANVDGTKVQGGEGKTQIARLRDYEPGTIDVVLLSIGGNDATFSDVVEHCLFERCIGDSRWMERKLALVDRLGERVARTIRSVRDAAPGAEVYRIGYPDPLRPLPQDCGSLGSDGLLEFVLGVSNPIGYFADGKYKIDSGERKWLSETFIAHINERFDAATRLSGAHLIDVADAFRGFSICGDTPFAHGIKAGSETLGVGNESFHPSRQGQDELRRTALAQYPLAGFGSRPNPAPIDLDPPQPELAGDYLSIAVVGDEVFTSSSQGHVVIRDAASNTAVAVAIYSLGTIVGRGTTDANGNAEIPIRLDPSTAPGVHHLELWDEQGRKLGSAGYVVGAPRPCIGTPDVDGDGLTDACDLDPLDGPAADFDGDGRPNGEDGCPLVAVHGADGDGDGVPDACDPDAGADPFTTVVVSGPAAGRIGVPGPPLTVTVDRRAGGAATVRWDAPPQTGGAAIDGYRIEVLGTADVHATGADARALQLAGLEDGPVQVRVRAHNDAGWGAIGLSPRTDAVTGPVVTATVTATATATATASATATSTPTSRPQPPSPRPAPVVRPAITGGPNVVSAAPRLSRLSVRKRVLRATLTRGPATVRIVVERAKVVRCGKRRCTRWTRVGPVRSVRATSSLKVSLGKLRAGRHRTRLTATSLATGEQHSASVTFRISG